jgi:hypothetical protein
LGERKNLILGLSSFPEKWTEREVKSPGVAADREGWWTLHTYELIGQAGRNSSSEKK